MTAADAPMATNSTQILDRAECNRALDERLRQQTNGIMNIKRFRILKLLLATAILAVAVFGVLYGGDPTIIITVAILAAGALTSLELVEVVETYQTGKQQVNDDD